MFHCGVFRGMVGCVMLSATLLLSGCGGQQISSSAQDRSLEEGNDAEMARAVEKTPDNAGLGEETLPVGSATGSDSSASSSASSSDMASETEPVSETAVADTNLDAGVVPETETVPESAVAAVPGSDSTPESPESMVGSDPTTGTMDSASDPTTEEPPMVAGLMPEDPSASNAAAATEPEAAASSFGDIVLEDIYFDFDQFALREDARAKLEANADQLKTNEGWNLTIEGHCDERGTEAYNLVLGERRASTVKQYLDELGVQVADIKIISYGKERPFCTDHNDECWKSNRRAHFIIK